MPGLPFYICVHDYLRYKTCRYLKIRLRNIAPSSEVIFRILIWSQLQG